MPITEQLGDVLDYDKADAPEQQWYVTQTTTAYHGDANVEFALQPPYFQLPKQVTEQWRMRHDSTRQRSEVREYGYDDAGNQTLEVQANGVRTVSEYYQPGDNEEDCPPDPHGFVRHLKNRTVYPSPGFEAQPPAPILRTNYRYGRHGSVLPSRQRTLRRKVGEYWLQPKQEKLIELPANAWLSMQTTVRDTTFEYIANPSDSLLHGRVQAQAVVMHGKPEAMTLTEFEYDTLDNSTVLETLQTVIGFDDGDEYDEDVLGTQVVNVSYEVLRGGKSRGSKAIDVNVNFETFGPVDPGTDPDPDWPDPINSRLPLCSVYGAKSNQANELLPVDDRLNATLKVDLYEGLEEHDLMEFYWGNTHITQADYQVKATDSAGDNITAEILWSYIQRTGNTTVPVHYEITRAGVPNKPASKNQSVTVSAVVVHPDAPGFEGVSDTGWLACEALVDPADPSLPAAVRVKVGDLSQYGLKENHLVTMHWKLLHAQSGDVEVLSWEQEIKLGTEYPPSGFIWRVEPYEDYILPLYEFDDDDHTGRAFSWYEFEDPSLREQGLDALIVSEVIEQKIAMHGVWGPCPVAFNRPQNNS